MSRVTLSHPLAVPISERHDPVLIAPGGDLVLDVSQEEASERFEYRVDSATLRQSSHYFENLLSDRFSEGRRISSALEGLKAAGYANAADSPVDVLPRVRIVNVGRIAISKGTGLRNLVADFLRAVHGQDLAVAAPPVPNLANLAVVADRFDAVEAVAAFVQRKKYLQTADARANKDKALVGLAEERTRQKILVGLVFDHAPWVGRHSRQLIMRDSVQWQPEGQEDHDKALWWDVPDGIEAEMIRRRELILETINSVQSHFLRLYTSGERQCKLGYDSSVQCDSFQLGEMVRFFSKSNTLRLQGTIYDATEPSYYAGDIDRLLDSLRQCPSYQVDRNHAHCGLRSRVIPFLDLIQTYLSPDTGGHEVGICLDCWRHNRSQYAWSSAKRPVLWTPKTITGLRTSANRFTKGDQTSRRDCLHRHAVVRDLFLATEKNWTAREGLRGCFTQNAACHGDQL